MAAKISYKEKIIKKLTLEYKDYKPILRFFIRPYPKFSSYSSSNGYLVANIKQIDGDWRVFMISSGLFTFSQYPSLKKDIDERIYDILNLHKKEIKQLKRKENLSKILKNGQKN